MAKKNLYEGNHQSEVKPELNNNGVSKTKKEIGVTSKKEVAVEKKEAEAEKTKDSARISRTRTDSDSYGKQFASLQALVITSRA